MRENEYRKENDRKNMEIEINRRKAEERKN